MNTMKFKAISLIFGLTVLVWFATYSCIPLPENGKEGAKCFSNNTCLPDLVCNDEAICVRLSIEDGGTDGGVTDGGTKDGGVKDGGGVADAGTKDGGVKDGGVCTSVTPVIDCLDYGGKLGWMCTVQAGCFRMGCNIEVDSECQSNESPYHEVTTGTYKIDKYEVTAAQYKACVTAGGCSVVQSGTGCNFDVSGKESHPINCVNWYDANDYCKWAGKRLPSEAEWEKAARGTDERKYPWGNDSLNCDRAVQNATACGNTGTAEIGSKPLGASPYGALDMIGNVWEWVEDDYHSTYNNAPTEGTAWLDSPRASDRVLRSGAWYIFDTANLRSSFRYNDSPAFESGNNGFRCVFSSDESDGGTGSDAGYDAGYDAGKDAGADIGLAAACASKYCSDSVEIGGNSYYCFSENCGSGKYCGYKVDTAHPGKTVQCNNCNSSGKGVGEDCKAQSDCKCGTDCLSVYSLYLDGGTGPTLEGPCLSDCLHTYGSCEAGQECVSRTFADGRAISDCFFTSDLTVPADPFTISLGSSCKTAITSAYKVSFKFGDTTYTFTDIGACIIESPWVQVYLTGTKGGLPDGGSIDGSVTDGGDIDGGIANGDFDKIELYFILTQTNMTTAGKKNFEWLNSNAKVDVNAIGNMLDGSEYSRTENIAFGLYGTLEFTSAGTTAGSILSGSISGTMMKYKMLFCDQSSGVPTKCHNP